MCPLQNSVKGDYDLFSFFFAIFALFSPFPSFLLSFLEGKGFSWYEFWAWGLVCRTGSPVTIKV